MAEREEIALGATLDTLLKAVRRQLAECRAEDADFEARLLVEHFTGTSRTDAISDPDRPVTRQAVGEIDAALARRRAGEPVYRILGFREFYGLTLKLSPQTLEPRPDTETLVDLALAEARRIVASRGRCRILDLGTGTGAIALALLSMVPEAEAVGVDISEEALATARTNADINGQRERFVALRSNWLTDVDGMFDLIVSNPPYIPTADLETLSREVREHDPRAALDGGADGLDFYRSIAAGAHRHLEGEGAVAVETGYNQKSAVEAIFAKEGYSTVRTARDLGGRDRAMLFMPVRSG
ncbi:peptide chain release factor N(5)-glutamine methyltransferase [Chelativorans salis]|uniref:Release factor glutamine methyltransferase n=1 Tax=Chelativorans salis TaxID=2978478 RepID=A0ABT2LV86_9HYPH|nr:peptide chain release factor N(5)-glutamine methyltransferase [Chelativorans sp. EGI FJ00035]MCT7377488.1 peptide chain release factor N(5)-glutamine methyltransferase [Chelativorans sp. EGI FJ00035]